MILQSGPSQRMSAQYSIQHLSTLSVSNFPSSGQILQPQLGDSFEFRPIYNRSWRTDWARMSEACLTCRLVCAFFSPLLHIIFFPDAICAYVSTVLPLGFGGSFRMSFFHVLDAHSVCSIGNSRSVERQRSLPGTWCKLSHGAAIIS